MKITSVAPGKLFIAGEYAVVSAGQPAIIAAVSQYLQVTLTTSTASCGSIHSSQNPQLLLRWTRKKNLLTILDRMDPYKLVTTAIQISEQYATELGYWNPALFDLAITSKLDDSASNTKFGLGSSGAVVVATIQAILKFHGVPFQAMDLYKLATLTHLHIGSNGSLGDVAASSFGGMVYYQRTNPVWLEEQRAQLSISGLVQMSWPQLAIESLTLPQPLQLLVGWTKSKADTTDFVNSMFQERSKAEKEHFHQQFLQENQTIVQSLKQACVLQQVQAFHEGIRYNRQLLQKFANTMGLTIETPALTTLCTLAENQNASAKTSGAGGGDCGICFAETEQQAASISQAWEAANIQPLPLTIATIQDYT